MKHLLFLWLITSLLFLSCTREPESDRAKVGDALPVDSVNPGTTYYIDTTTSIITWVGTKPTGRHNGIFRIKDGEFNVLEEEKEADNRGRNTIEHQINKARIVVDMTSIDILDLKHDPEQYYKLLEHLHSPDFFYTDSFPEAVFELTDIEKLAPDSTRRTPTEFTIIDPTHTVTGNLTMRGVTRSVEFPVKIDIRNLKLEASAKFNIDRTDWDINYMNQRDPVARAKDSFINNIVNVGFEIIAFSEAP